MDKVQITATPMGKQWALECTICGPLALVASGSEDRAIGDHARTHHVPVGVK